MRSAPGFGRFDLGRWRAAHRRNRAIAVANYVQRVSQTAQNPEARNDLRGDLVVMSRGLHAVLALHSPIRDRAGRSWCQGCSTRWHHAGWPCATRNAVVCELTHLGALE